MLVYILVDKMLCPNTLNARVRSPKNKIRLNGTVLLFYKIIDKNLNKSYKFRHPKNLL